MVYFCIFKNTHPHPFTVFAFRFTFSRAVLCGHSFRHIRSFCHGTMA